jgi:membrane associated rhomboid family serine protease
MAGTPRTRSTWNLGTDDPATVLANARKALFIMTGFLAVIWIVQIANWADSYSLTYHYGIQARDVASLPDILTAPFLHVSWAHIEGNSGPLFIFGFLAAYRGIPKFLGVTGVVVLTSGLGAWLTHSASIVGVGASGVIFGYFGYVMVRGIFDRHAIDLLIGAVMALSFAYQFSVLLPQPGIGYQAHIGGLVGGVASGWIFRDRRVRARAAGGLPGGSTTGLTTTGTGTGRAGTGKTVAVDPSRAELHKQLDDLGL